jgi:hypothetical protein
MKSLMLIGMCATMLIGSSSAAFARNYHANGFRGANHAQHNHYFRHQQRQQHYRHHRMWR